MKYLVMIYGDEAALAKRAPSDATAMSQAHGAYAEALAKAGVLQGGQRLQPTSAATSLRLRGDKTEVLNGPYAETREQLGGYYMIDVPDLDEALKWAARCPSLAEGTIEVRPIWEM
ncbi:MAG: YciI family protein [Proteobacteria bacterium]|nr:YciI family protein [Pseudomonadota bacterium]